jgi:hypothetical protein
MRYAANGEGMGGWRKWGGEGKLRSVLKRRPNEFWLGPTSGRRWRAYHDIPGRLEGRAESTLHVLRSGVHGWQAVYSGKRRRD